MQFDGLAPEVIHELLLADMKNIHKCWLMKKSIGQYLPNSIQMIEKILRRRKKGMKRVLFDILGVKITARINYLKNLLLNFNYPKQLLNEEFGWRKDPGAV